MLAMPMPIVPIPRDSALRPRCGSVPKSFRLSPCLNSQAFPESNAPEVGEFGACDLRYRIWVCDRPLAACDRLRPVDCATMDAVASPSAYRLSGSFGAVLDGLGVVLFPPVGSVAITKRKYRGNLTSKTNGWKTKLNTLTVRYGDRTADHIK